MAGAAIVGAVATVAGAVAPLLTSDDDAGASAAALQTAGQQRGIDEIRRRFEGTEANIQPFIDAGLTALPEVERAATVEGLDERLAQIFNTDIFGALTEERGRAVALRDAASGNFGSGAGFLEAARVPTETGLNLENLLTQRLTGISSGGVNAAGNLGQLSAQAGTSIAELFSGQGLAQAEGSLFDAGARTARNEALFGTISGVGGALLPPGGFSNLNTNQQLARLSTGFGASDRRLKKNITKVTELKGLDVYCWEWIDEIKGSILASCQRIGFMADDVKKKYPEFVHVFGGMDVIDYGSLLDKLETV